jgi:hypothetical protein
MCPTFRAACIMAEVAPIPANTAAAGKGNRSREKISPGRARGLGYLEGPAMENASFAAPPYAFLTAPGSVRAAARARGRF